MRRSRLLRWIVFIALLAPAAVFAQSFAAPTPTLTYIPGRQVLLRAGTVSSNAHIPLSRSARANIQTATIIVNYTGSWTPSAQAAFQFAVDIWQATISSSVPITIDAHWEPLASGVLGSAGPNQFFSGFPNQPIANTYYPIALANALAGVDLDPTAADMDAQFNSTFANWYFGTDGNTPSNKIDFASAVLHELTHGLGFLGSMNVLGGIGSWGINESGIARPFIFDHFAVNGANQRLIDAFPNISAALAAQLTSNNIFFAGALSTAAAGGTPPKLYTPTSWSTGSSYSHLDEATYPPGNPNALMTFQITPGESIHDPGPIPICMFADMGWSTTCDTGFALTATAVSAVTATALSANAANAATAAANAATAAADAAAATASAATATAFSQQSQTRAYLPVVVVPAITGARLSERIALPSRSPTPTRTTTATATR